MLREWLRKHSTPQGSPRQHCRLWFVSSEPGQEGTLQAVGGGGGRVREVTLPSPDARLPSSLLLGGHTGAPTELILVAPALVLAIASGVSGVHVGLTPPSDKKLQAGVSHSCTSAQG